MTKYSQLTGIWVSLLGDDQMQILVERQKTTKMSMILHAMLNIIKDIVPGNFFSILKLLNLSALGNPMSA